MGILNLIHIRKDTEVENQSSLSTNYLSCTKQKNKIKNISLEN